VARQLLERGERVRALVRIRTQREVLAELAGIETYAAICGTKTP
jgi:hypothetical protein